MGFGSQQSGVHIPGVPHVHGVGATLWSLTCETEENVTGELKGMNKPCLVWLSGLSAGLRTKGSLVQFPVRAHAWVAGQVPSGGVHERQPHTDVSLPLFPSVNK